jgi:tetratricopeptide (TPR) repeat protein
MMSPNTTRPRLRLACALFVALLVSSAATPTRAASDPPNTAGTALASTPEAAFAQANQRYFAGDWQGARELYQRLLERFELEDAALYHNLGNACFRSGAYGSAILYYRRAQALEPDSALGDALDKNLDAARRTLQARYRAGSDSALVYASPADALYQATHVVGEAPLALGFLVAWVSLFSLLVVRRLRPHTRWPGRLAIAAFVLALLSGLLLAGRVMSESSHQLAIVVASDALLRDGRHELAQGRELAEGLEVKIVDAQDDWLQIELASGKRGWVSASQVKQI